jgi:hypothetical protein
LIPTAATSSLIKYPPTVPTLCHLRPHIPDRKIFLINTLTNIAC